DRPLETDEDNDPTLLFVVLSPDDSEVTLLLVVDRPLETDEDSDDTLLLVELRPLDSEVTLLVVVDSPVDSDPTLVEVEDDKDETV
ncbi:hypothetical protein, partial [Burkholderia gladioli]|uniref:hypothetical protein n=1 Tax=Burkholderia gladioli TaxID=28095 RepID=UPI00163F93BF